MENINFALALNKPHPKNCQEWNILEKKYKVKKLSSRFFAKETDENRKEKIVNKELHSDNFKFTGIDFEKLIAAQHAQLKSFTPNVNCFAYFDFVPDWRFIVGLGISTIYETGISLHHIYGIPYIPASSIKGTVRSWYLQDKYHENIEECEGLAISTDELFCRVFGCPKEVKVNGKTYSSILTHQGKSAEFKGNVIFLDAFPLKTPKLKVDIMTPHYQPYYDSNSGKKPPADYYSPNPIPFLTVQDTKFRIYFGVKNLKNQDLLPIVKDWIKNALLYKGIGAKTAVGYGYHKTIQEGKSASPNNPSSTPNYYGDKKLKEGENIEGEIILDGNDKNVRLFFKKDEKDIIVNVRYGLGFKKEDVGKIVVLKIKNLQGPKNKQRINPSGFDFVNFR